MRPCRYMLVLGILAAGLTACGDSSAPDGDPLPDNAATAVGLTVRDNVEASLDAFYPARLLQPFTHRRGAGPLRHPVRRHRHRRRRRARRRQLHLHRAPCRFPDVRGFTLDVVGQLRVVDPAPETAGFGANITSPSSASA